MVMFMGRIKKEIDYISDKDYSDILKRLYKIANKLHIPMWLSFGTLLGYAQQHKRFEWDNDIDIGTTTKGFDKLLQNLDLIKQEGFFIRDKVLKPKCYRGLFIYDKKIQPFHVDISEFIIDKHNRYTFRWLIRVNIPSKCFDYLYKVFLTILEFTNKNKKIPFFDSKQYSNYKKNKITGTIADMLYKIDLFFTTTRELKMKVDTFKKVKYYGITVLVPFPIDSYCEVNYGKNWRNPIKKRKTLGGSECLKEKIDGIERCYLE